MAGVVSYIYDSQGRVIREDNAAGNDFVYTYFGISEGIKTKEERDPANTLVCTYLYAQGSSNPYGRLEANGDFIDLSVFRLPY